MAADAFDSRELRQVLGTFVTGVTVVTTLDSSGKAHGVTANSFSSVSLDPPLVLWSQSVAAGSYPAFRDAERFAVNILADDQIAISDRFAKSGHDKFAGVEVRPGLGGLPLIGNCAGYLECAKVASYPGGDHSVFIGRVERIERAARKPLVFGSGRYLVAHPHDLTSFSDDVVTGAVQTHAVRAATAALPRLAQELDEVIALAVWGNHGPTILRWEEPADPSHRDLRAGIVLPVTATATGLVFAAFSPRELTQSFIDAELNQAMHNQSVDRQEVWQRLEEDLRAVRARGCACIFKRPSGADLQVAGNSVVSVPVFDGSGAPLLALTVVGHPGRDDADWMAGTAKALKQRASLLSGRFGYQQS